MIVKENLSWMFYFPLYIDISRGTKKYFTVVLNIKDISPGIFIIAAVKRRSNNVLLVLTKLIHYKIQY